MDIVPQNPVKICKFCERQLPATKNVFGIDRHSPDGLGRRCKECRRKRANDAYAANPQKYLDQCAKYRANHREEIKTRKRERYANRTDEQRKHDQEYWRNHQFTHPDLWNKYSQQYRARHPEKVQFRNKLYGWRYRSSTKADFTRAEYDRAMAYWDNKCAACGRSAGLWHVIALDHWMPIQKGGVHSADNLVPMCHDKKDGRGGCNNSKNNRDAGEWLSDRFGKRKAAQILKRINAYFEWVRAQDDHKRRMG